MAPGTNRLTAHQLWINRITKELEKVILPNRKKLEAAVSAVSNFETTKLRILTDEMILLLDESKSEVNRLHKEHSSTHWLLWKKRRKLQQDYLIARALQDAYQKGVLILVNTPPPPGVGDKAVMNVVKD